MLASWIDSKTLIYVMVSVQLLRSNLVVNPSSRELPWMRHGSYLISFYADGRGEMDVESVNRGEDIRKQGKGMNIMLKENRNGHYVNQGNADVG